MSHKAWLPTGKLSDGTLLFGPLKERPTEHGPVVEIAIDGVTWFVAHSGEKIAASVQAEFESWARTRVASYQKK